MMNEDKLKSRKDSRKTFADKKEAGVYQVSQKVGKKTETQQFVVNFPVDSESDIKSKISQQTGASKAFEIYTFR